MLDIIRIVCSREHDGAILEAVSLFCDNLLAKTLTWLTDWLTSVDLIWPLAWISSPNKEKLSHVLIHIEAFKHQSEEMKQISLVFSESELFKNCPIGLALRGRELPLTSGQKYILKKQDNILYKSLN